MRALPLALVLFWGAGCSSEPYGKTVTVSLDYQGASAGVLQLPDGMSAMFNPPNQISGFDCLAVNIIGPGINSPTHGVPPPSILADIYAGSSCSYGGVGSRPITTTANTTIDLQVPAGGGRVIQMLGLHDPSGAFCGASHPYGGRLHEEHLFVQAYEVGRSITDLFSNKSISIGSIYNSIPLAQKKGKLAHCESLLYPYRYSGLKLWFEAADFGEADITGVTTSWSNKGFGNPSSLSAVSNPDFRVGNAALRQPHMVFPGGSNFHTSGVSFGGLSAATIFVVAAKPLTGAGSFIKVDAAGGNFIQVGYQSGNFRFDGFDGALDFVSIPGTSGFYVHVAQWNPSNAGSELYYEVSGYQTNSSAATLLPITLDNYVYVGNLADSAVAEVLFYDWAMPVVDRNKVRDYLKNKYDLP